jgi:hypothetical protein
MHSGNVPHILSSGQIMTRDQGSAGFARGVCDSYSSVHSEVKSYSTMGIAFDQTSWCNGVNSLHL